MKATGTSEFHGNMDVTFVGLKEGVNVRKLKGPRANYCLDYSNSNSHVCGCGFPVSRTTWEVSDPEYAVTECREVGGAYDYDYGKGWIEITIRPIQ